MGTRILIADDSKVARGLLRELLKSHDGWEVCAEVENGQQAVLKATELKPDLIILDLAMPVMDGLRATREIGQILPSVPILIYTLHKASWVELEAKKAGAREIVSKPDVETLLSAVERLLRKESQEPVQRAVLPAATTGAVAEITTLKIHTNPTELPGNRRGR